MSDSDSASQAAGFPVENSYFYGLIFSCIIYGIQVTMFIVSTYINMTNARSMFSSSSIYVLLGSIMILLRTIGLFANVVLLNFAWISHRDFPGGPLGYVAANTSVWWQVLGNVAAQVTFFIADGILIYRCYVIWDSRWKIIVFPMLTYLVSVAMALVLTIETSIPGSNFFVGIQVNFGITWATFSATTSVLVTGLICYKLLSARKEFIQVLGHSQESLRTYTGPVAILIESALPYSILSVVWAVAYGKDSVSAPALSMIWGMVGALTPQFIIFRVTTGKAWAPNTFSTMVSSLAFQQSHSVDLPHATSREPALELKNRSWSSSRV